MPLVTPGFEIGQAQYPPDAVDQFGTYAVMGGLIAMTAYSLIGLGAFFTYSAAAAATPAAPLVTASITYTATHPITGAAVTGTVNYCVAGTAMTASQISGLATAQALALGGVAPVTLAPFLSSLGFMKLLSLEGLIALSLFDRVLQQGYYDNMGNWMGPSHGGGSQTPPGFPGFNATTVYNNFGGVYGCTIVDDVLECYWYH